MIFFLKNPVLITGLNLCKLCLAAHVALWAARRKGSSGTSRIPKPTCATHTNDANASAMREEKAPCGKDSGLHQRNSTNGTYFKSCIWPPYRCLSDHGCLDGNDHCSSNQQSQELTLKFCRIWFAQGLNCVCESSCLHPWGMFVTGPWSVIHQQFPPSPLFMSRAGARANTVIGYVQSRAPVVPGLSIPGMLRLAFTWLTCSCQSKQGTKNYKVPTWPENSSGQTIASHYTLETSRFHRGTNTCPYRISSRYPDSFRGFLMAFSRQQFSWICFVAYWPVRFWFKIA